MKILHIHEMYSDYLKSFYYMHPELASKGYSDVLFAVENDFMDWGRGYVDGLIANGIEAEHIIIPNSFAYESDYLIRRWREENLPSDKDYSDVDVVVEQVKKIHPDVVLFFTWHKEIFYRLKNECPFVKKYVGWIGSALFGFDLMKHMDLVLCCAPENIDALQSSGINAVHVNHAFNPKINQRLSDNNKSGVVFIGQIVRQSEYHLQREKILLEIITKVPIDIYSPSYNYRKKEIIKGLLKKGAYYGNRVINSISLGKVNAFLSQVPYYKKVSNWKESPMLPINLRLMRYLQPQVWGLRMFDVLHNSMVALNIHADSSPIFASNMRLFEITGVGSCLLTDRKRNISELFEENKECVVYDNAVDCAEKIEWLIKHPLKCKEIAKAGQERCLRDYTNIQQGKAIREYIEKNW